MPAGKRARGASASSTSVTLPAIPVLYRIGVLQASLESVKHNHDEYFKVHSALYESSREDNTYGVRFGGVARAGVAIGSGC